MTEHRIGVADIIHPTQEELELIPHGYVHNLHIHALKASGWVQHPDYASVGGEIPGYYVLMYKGEK